MERAEDQGDLEIHHRIAGQEPFQGRFLNQNDYPTASALSFILMAAILVAITVYARVLGTEELQAGRA